MLAKELNIADPKIIDVNYRDFRDNTPINAEITPEAAQNTLVQLGVSGRLEDYVDTSLLEEIRNEGFIARLQQKYKR